MKKSIILMAVAALALAGCHRDPDPTLTVTPADLSFEAAGGSETIVINSNTSWLLKTDGQTWYKVSEGYGEGNASLDVTVEAYDEAAGRSAQITVTTVEGLVQTVAIVQARPVPPADPSKVSFNIQAREQDLTVDVPAGYAYKVSAPAGVSVASQEKTAVTLHFDANYTAENKAYEILIQTSDDQLLETVNVTQSWRNVEPGELLIEEVYFTGSPIEGSTSPSTDQYFRLTNNTDHTVYADRTMLVFHYGQYTITSVGAHNDYPELTDEIAVEDMFVIPGNGTDHPVEPGKSLILALSAQNYTETNPNAFDLSGADFEIFDNDDFGMDTDNPDVPNMDIWFKSSYTITSLHNRGLESYAIVSVPFTETAESIMANRHWTGTYTFDFNQWHFEFDLADEDAWLIPGDWVLDAVNCSLEDSWYKNPWAPRFDAGWTHAGDYDGDPNRFGKSVRRMTKEGKLLDTNNSTNDFEPNATPTLKK